MARTPDKTEKHTPESIAHAAAELERLASGLRISASILKGDENQAAIPSIDVRYEPSLTEGLQFLRNWTNEVARCANEARREAAKKPDNNRVRKTGHASGRAEK